MIGRTLLLGADVRNDFMTRGGAYKIKSLVGGDVLEAELKGSNSKFSIYGTFNVLITSNVRLLIRIMEDRSAWERRLWIIRYDKPFDGLRIPEIHQMLIREESSGILNWALTGLKSALNDVSQTGDIILCGAQKQRVIDLLSESDSLRLFVQNEIVKDTTLTGNKQRHSLTTEEILNAYVADCVGVKHWVPAPWAVAQKNLPDLMVQIHGITKSHDLQRDGKSRRGYWNVRF
jgi:phage/plasmid-associated DNA primase